MTHVAAPHYVDQLGLIVGGFGIIVGLYLKYVSPYDHDKGAIAGFLSIGAAILLLSSEALLLADVWVITGRLAAMTILAFIQMWLFLRVYLRGPFPTPRESMMIHLVAVDAAEAEEDLSYVEMYRRALEVVRNGSELG